MNGSEPSDRASAGTPRLQRIRDVIVQLSPSTSHPTMRAVVQHEYGDTSVLTLERVPRPSPLPTEVLVRVHAAGVNPVDWKTREGSGMAHVLGPMFTLGWDVAGVVEEVGYGVTTLAPGDRVYGRPWFPREAGGYADYVTAPSRQFAKMPTSIGFEHAAAVPLAGLTAWQLLVDTAHAQAGQRVVINAAAGGVGHFAVQIAKHLVLQPHVWRCAATCVMASSGTGLVSAAPG
jgi:NADPH:quinone reductase-like Zn-dependent oxidoreductase